MVNESDIDLKVRLDAPDMNVLLTSRVDDDGVVADAQVRIRPNDARTVGELEFMVAAMATELAMRFTDPDALAAIGSGFARAVTYCSAELKRLDHQELLVVILNGAMAAPLAAGAEVPVATTTTTH